MRIRKARNLRPWQVDTFKLSNDKDFEAKLVDVVGLYLDPAEGAVVFSFDEKTQCQSLDRTQLSLPIKPGRGWTMTRDYRRNGTVDLLAAMTIATGEVLRGTKRRHADADVLAFFEWIVCTLCVSSMCMSCWTTCRHTSLSRSAPGSRIRNGLVGICTAHRRRRRG